MSQSISVKKTYVLFYSWQSDLDAKCNKNLISNQIKKAVEETNKSNLSALEFEISIDRDTKDKSGSPDIADTIFDKISKSDIFICDVSIINNFLSDKSLEKRLMPNPNVLIELGFAVHSLGWERIICINNLKYSQPELLPFDIRGRRITNYNSDNSDSKSVLKSILKNAILSIINDYENILFRHSQKGIIIHDKNIYAAINNICDEVTLKESISTAVNSLYTNDYYYNRWSKLDRFYYETINHFLDRELDCLYKDFIRNLNTFHYECATSFHDDERDSHTINQLVENGVQMTDSMRYEYEQNVVYRPIKKPFHNETWSDADDRIDQLQSELYEFGEKVKLSYQQLILKLKAKLMT